MREGCQSFVAGWQDEIVASLVNRPDDEAPIKKLCFNISKACDNVDPSNVPHFDNKIHVDGEEVDIVL
jgi:hypothetical protein